MQTKFNVGEKVVIKRLPENSYTIKAISATQTEEMYLVHYKMMGLSGWVPEENILGNVTYESTN